MSGGKTPEPYLRERLPVRDAEFFLRQFRGGQARLSGDELGDIIAFAHDANLQSTFTKKDLPPDNAVRVQRAQTTPEHPGKVMLINIARPRV